ncbi:collagen-like domain-containing protein [Pasteurella canis]|uniref:hypothetical protein n=1 Tax=Pasteurella canis TaxID=753 RepID=UPI0013245FCE|nr:hypothetical protein [Pasteurella canis]MXN88608.1 hypothetical protein [Pasteurella canis]
MTNLNKRLIDFAQAVSEKVRSILRKTNELEQRIQEISLTAGPPGQDGTPGRDGIDGATFTPSVSQAGELTWSNNKELPNPPNVNIKGSKGDPGETGATFKPNVNSSGVLSWTNDKGLPNPPNVNIKGSKGDPGETGATFKPNVNSSGVLSWTNDKGLPNPPNINIKGPRGPAGYEGEISNSYNGNRRNIPVSEYAVGELYNYVYESLQAQPERVWAGNVNSGDITLSKNVLGKTVIVLMQHGQSHTLTDNNLVEVVSFNAFNIENKNSGDISFTSVIWYHSWTDVRQLRFDISASGTTMRVSSAGGRYLKEVYII